MYMISHNPANAFGAKTQFSYHSLNKLYFCSTSLKILFGKPIEMAIILKRVVNYK